LWDALRASLDRRGYLLLRKHYFLPIPNEQDRASAFAQGGSELPGVALDVDGALGFLDNVVVPTLDEFRASFGFQPDANGRFALLNGSFMAIDAHVFWGVLRTLRPRRVVEVGAGASSLLALEALARNRAEGHPAVLTSIDPFPLPHLSSLHVELESFTLVESRVQDVSLETLTALDDGDVLFIDSTHVLKEGGDVHYLYGEVLPRLGEGVLVHVHDVSLPRPYPRSYADQDIFWNEQYLLQAFLVFNSHFEVLWPGNWVTLRAAERVQALFPELEAMRRTYPESEPTSFWMRVHS
jgi:hypothetical protein